jgi:hypothetical protein
MALINNDQAKIRQYLLGHLSDEEQRKIEERLMVEDDLFEELEITKGELIEEYCSGDLAQNDREWFEHHYLASPEGRQRHTFTLALNCLKRPVPVPQRPTWFERLASFFRTQRWAVATATSLGVLALVSILFYPQYPQPQSPVSITLMNSAIVRSDGNDSTPPITVTLPSDAGELRASLPLPRTSTPAVQRYRAELDNRTEKKSVKVAEHNDNSVLVVIPAAVLPHGIYELTLTAIQADGTEQAVPGSYRFNVE